MATAYESFRNIMYLTGQHPVIPDDPFLTISITHVVLAFMPSGIFNEEHPDPAWPLFMSVGDVRSRFQQPEVINGLSGATTASSRPETKVMVAIGGWGDTEGFAVAARDPSTRRRFAENVAAMVRVTGADGVDIDWEYPGGNGEDYKQTPNAEKAWEAAAYPQLLAALRAALGPSKTISAAVPGIPRDIALAFTAATVPAVMRSVDFLNVMTYDLMNRRDAATKHHAGVAGSLEALEAYLAAGAPAARLNLGFAFYVKYFRVPRGACDAVGAGDPATGADLGRTGGFSYHDSIPADVEESFRRALTEGTYDESGGGYYYLDDNPDGDGKGNDSLFWTFETEDAIFKKYTHIVTQKALGGVFAWGLGEDAPSFRHLRKLSESAERTRQERLLIHLMVKDEL
ncbi:glycoside hydrolase family 18 protein [Apiospora kogelbergensis]|uniref:glycoside hydrolase family 18 protein n=1 Tax=Apiospora kogelbergensis TaxID=1337665 RepID=UPI003130350A